MLGVKKLYKLLPISQTVASWVLEKGDFAWFNQEYQEMFDLIKDSPAYKLLKEQTRQELAPEYEQKLLEERKQAEKEFAFLRPRRRVSAREVCYSLAIHSNILTGGDTHGKGTY